MTRSIKTIIEALAPNEKIVPFTEFVESPEYCNTLGIYDYWLSEGEKLNDPKELILDGSLGTGKTTFADYYVVYRLYKLFSMPSLRKYLGILEETPVYILYFSTSITTAKRSGFQTLINIIDNCLWFKNNFPRDMNLSSSIKFPNGFSIEYASSEGHQISLNVIGFILDEANFRKGLGKGNDVEYDEVTQLYSQLIDRQITRFATPVGSRAFGILISSASYQSSFVEKRKGQIAEVADTAVITSVSYIVKPDNYSKEMFEVFIGTGTIEACIINNREHKDILLRKLSMENLSILSDKYFRTVPESIRSTYEINVSLALQNHSGVPTQIQGRLFSNMTVVHAATFKSEKPWFPSHTTILSNKDEFQLYDILITDNIQFQDRPHSFYLDLSISGDPGGFSCYRNDSTMDKQLHTHIFTLTITPPQFPGETKISKILDFMEYLDGVVNVANFASDQYQSKMLRQEIVELVGVPDIRLSIDSSDEFFLHWIRGLIEEKANVLEHPTLFKELESLIHNTRTRRVLKAKGMTDDISQSIVGAYFLSSVYTEAVGDTDLHKLRSNVIGNAKVKRMIKSLGYK